MFSKVTVLHGSTPFSLTLTLKILIWQKDTKEIPIFDSILKTTELCSWEKIQVPFPKSWNHSFSFNFCIYKSKSPIEQTVLYSLDVHDSRVA